MINHANFSTAQNTSVTFQFMADVELGVPSKKCKNFGICRIYPVGVTEDFESNQLERMDSKCSENNSIGAVVSVMENDSVEVCFLRHYVDESTYQKHFSSGRFLVEEDFRFSKQNKVNIDFTIKKGNYPLKVNKTLITVLFTV